MRVIGNKSDYSPAIFPRFDQGEVRSGVSERVCKLTALPLRSSRRTAQRGFLTGADRVM